MRRLLLALILAGFMLLPTAVAHATPPAPAAGQFTVVAQVFHSFRVVDNQLFVEATNTVVYTGTFTGTDVCTVTARIDLATGVGDFHCEGPFNGTVEGVPDTFVIRIDGRQDGAVAHAQWVILGHKDQTNQTDWHAEGTLVQVGKSGTYEGQIHRAPAA
jgi:hypothetical protein